MEEAISAKVAAIVLAGGEGTRLFPLTQGRCKPDVSFAGRYRLIDIPLSNSINSKIHNIFVLAQYFISSLQDHIHATYPHQFFQRGGIELISPKAQKTTFKGTADAVRQNIDQISAADAEYFLILSGDQLYQMDYNAILDFAKKEDADLVIAVLAVKEREAKRMGLLKIDADSHVLDFVEKPTDPAVLSRFAVNKDEYLGSMGVYVFKREALLNLLKKQGQDFGKHLIPLQIKTGKTSAFVFHDYWEDIGTIHSYHQANLALTNSDNWMGAYNPSNPLFTPHHNHSTPIIKNTLIQDSLINEGSRVEAQEIHHSIVGIGAWIEQGTILHDSIIMGYPGSPATKIGKKCLIRDAILDSNVTIEDNVQLINKNHLDTYDGAGVYIRDGIIIVTSGTKVPAGFVI